MKTKKKTRPPTSTNRFRPGATGECESQLWSFSCPPGISSDDNTPQIHWVAAESLEEALQYMRKRHDDFIGNPPVSTRVLHYRSVMVYKGEALGAHPVRGKGSAHPPKTNRRLRAFFQPDSCGLQACK
jgi:hypothetical protein